MTGSSYTISHTCKDGAKNEDSCDKTYYYNSSSACGDGFSCHENDGSYYSCEDWPGTALFETDKCKLCINNDCSMFERKPAKLKYYSCTHTCYPTCWHS